MKKYNLFLDDVRDPIEVYEYTNDKIYINSIWVIVRSYEEFVKYILENGIPQNISFDHDLGYHKIIEKNGYDAIKWLCDYILDNDTTIPINRYHTANPVGLVNMRTYFNNFIKYYV